MRHPTGEEREALGKLIDDCGMAEILRSLGSVARFRGQDELGSTLLKAAQDAEEAAFVAEVSAYVIAADEVKS